MVQADSTMPDPLAAPDPSAQSSAAPAKPSTAPESSAAPKLYEEPDLSSRKCSCRNLHAFLIKSEFEHLEQHLHAQTAEGLLDELATSRPTFLAKLKSLGCARLPERQAVANALSKARLNGDFDHLSIHLPPTKRPPKIQKPTAEFVMGQRQNWVARAADGAAAGSGAAARDARRSTPDAGSASQRGWYDQGSVSLGQTSCVSRFASPCNPGYRLFASCTCRAAHVPAPPTASCRAPSPAVSPSPLHAAACSPRRPRTHTKLPRSPDRRARCGGRRDQANRQGCPGRRGASYVAAVERAIVAGALPRSGEQEPVWWEEPVLGCPHFRPRRRGVLRYGVGGTVGNNT